MTMRKVTINMQVKLVMLVDEGTEVSEIINELDFNFADTTTKATIEDTTIEDFEVVDSR